MTDDDLPMDEYRRAGLEITRGNDSVLAHRDLVEIAMHIQADRATDPSGYSQPSRSR